MTDFSSLQLKVNALKAMVEQNSITPALIGALLDDLINQMMAIDMTDMSDQIRAAINNAASALEAASASAQNAAAAASSAELAAQKSADTKTAADAAIAQISSLTENLNALQSLVLDSRDTARIAAIIASDISDGIRRNILIGTNLGVSRWSFAPQNPNYIFSSDGPAMTIENIGYPNSAAPFEVLGFELPAGAIQRKGTYSLSFDIAHLNDGEPSLRMAARIATFSNSSILAPDRFFTIQGSEESHHVCVNLEVADPAAATGAELILIAVSAECTGKWCALSVRNLKLEYGDNETPYVKAPEDRIG